MMLMGKTANCLLRHSVQRCVKRHMSRSRIGILPHRPKEVYVKKGNFGRDSVSLLSYKKLP